MREESDPAAVLAGPPSARPGARSLGQRLVRGGGWSLLGRTVALPVGVLQAMLLARILEPAEVGAYFLAMTLAFLLAVVAQGGMGQAMVKLVAAALTRDEPQVARHAIRVVFALTLATGGVLALALADGPGRWLAGLLHGGEFLLPELPTLALIVLAFALIDLTAETLRGFHDLRAASTFADLLLPRLLVSIAFAIAWVLWGSLDLDLILLFVLVAGLAALLLALGLLWPHVAALGRHGPSGSTAHVLGHAPSFLLVRLNLWLMTGADIWVLGMFRPPEDVAIYGVATRLAVFIGLPLVVCSGVLAPLIAELHSQGDRQRLERVVRSAATVSILPTLGLFAVFALFGDRLLQLVFTSPYADGYALLVLLALGRSGSVFCGAAALSLTMSGHQRDVMTVGVAAAVAMVAGYLVAVQAYGAVGVACVAALALLAYNAALAAIARHRLGIRTWATPSPAALRGLLVEFRRALG